MKRLIAAILCLVLLGLGTASAEVKAGSVVSFGHYEQDNDTKNGPEELLWWVVRVEGKNALLLSGYGLDVRPFGGMVWETCGLRHWLNYTFRLDAFSTEEQARILETVLHTPGNTAYDKPGSPDTTDWVFVLSEEEFMQYLNSAGTSMMVKTQATAYAGSRTKEKYLKSWWLRTPASHRDAHMMIVSFGAISRLGHPNNDKSQTLVRPAMWVRLEDEAAP